MLKYLFSSYISKALVHYFSLYLLLKSLAYTLYNTKTPPSNQPPQKQPKTKQPGTFRIFYCDCFAVERRDKNRLQVNELGVINPELNSHCIQAEMPLFIYTHIYISIFMTISYDINSVEYHFLRAHIKQRNMLRTSDRVRI